jgi:hypothetical protein
MRMGYYALKTKTISTLFTHVFGTVAENGFKEIG